MPRICHFLDRCYHNSSQSVPPGRMLLRPYGLVTIFVLSHMRMDVCMSHGSKLLTSLRHMTISITCGYWGTLPLLLFSDPHMVYPVNVYDFQGQAVHRLHQQHIQLGGKAWQCLCTTEFRADPMRTQFSRLFSSHEEIWIFGALCLYWCDVELHI